METAIEHTGSKRRTLDEEKARGLLREAIERKVSTRSPGSHDGWRSTAGHQGGADSPIGDRLA
jgi:hypothetical protein